MSLVKKYGIVISIALAGLAIEAMLLTRIWAQASARSLDSSGMQVLFSVTDDLASLFSPFTGREPLQATGIIDYAVLFAAEVYLVGTLSLLGVTVVATQGWALFGRLRTRELPEFVREQMEARRPRPRWQPARSPRAVDARYYVPLRRGAGPEHTKSSLSN